MKMDTEMEFEAYSKLTNIQNFFYGQSVFLTGVTGLVGKVVLEKLLRSCPGIGIVYILMRHKKGFTPQQRLDSLFKLELFKVVKQQFPEFRKKVQVIEGDISKDRLGISYEDYQTIINNVTIVIHSAASVHFSDPIKEASDHNLKATKYVLKMCHELPHIKAFVHVSTAYVKRESDGTVLEEIPKTKVQPDALLEALEWMDEKSQNTVCDYLTENNLLTTYLVTKALAEVEVDNNRGDIPTAIVRPSYIGPTYKEPFPGWIDSIQGISGLLLAGAKGVLRTLKSVENFKANVVPVDVVSNVIIASAWHAGTTKPPPLFIINAVLDFESLPLAEDFLPAVLLKRDEYPLANMFRYPDFTVYYNDFAYRLHALIDQWIPALFIDFLLLIFTGRPILIKIYRKISFLYDIFFRLGKEPWICRRENYVVLENNLSEEDAKIFTINTDNFAWLDYIDTCLIGGRKYLAHEDPSNIPYAKKKAYIWWLVTTTIKWILIGYLLYYLYCRSFSSPVYENIEEKVYEVPS